MLECPTLDGDPRVQPALEDRAYEPSSFWSVLTFLFFRLAAKPLVTALHGRDEQVGPQCPKLWFARLMGVLPKRGPLGRYQQTAVLPDMLKAQSFKP